VGRILAAAVVLSLAMACMGAEETPDKKETVEQALLYPDWVRPNQTPIDQQPGVIPGPAWHPKPDWTLLDELRSHRHTQSQQIQGLLSKLQADIDRRIESVTSRVQRVLRVIFWCVIAAGAFVVLLVLLVLYWLGSVVQAIWGLRQTVKTLQMALQLAGKLRGNDGTD